MKKRRIDILLPSSEEWREQVKEETDERLNQINFTSKEGFIQFMEFEVENFFESFASPIVHFIVDVKDREGNEVRVNECQNLLRRLSHQLNFFFIEGTSDFVKYDTKIRSLTKKYLDKVKVTDHLRS